MLGLQEIPRPQAVIQIQTNPINARVYIAGDFIGYSNLTHEIEPGSYQVIARLEGHNDAVINITAVEGQNPPFSMILTRNDPWGAAPPPVLPPTPVEPTPVPLPTPPPTAPPPDNNPPHEDHAPPEATPPEDEYDD